LSDPCSMLMSFHLIRPVQPNTEPQHWMFWLTHHCHGNMLLQKGSRTANV
jgi:hypothetical protein